MFSIDCCKFKKYYRHRPLNSWRQSNLLQKDILFIFFEGGKTKLGTNIALHAISPVGSYLFIYAQLLYDNEQLAKNIPM